MTDTMSPDAGSPAPDASNQVLMRVSNLVKEFPIKRGVFFKKQVGAVLTSRSWTMHALRPPELFSTVIRRSMFSGPRVPTPSSCGSQSKK